jgi:hypothetical protein
MIARVPDLVDEGMRLRAKIATLIKELEVVESALIAWAKDGDQVDLVDEEREGKQFLAGGSKVIVPVVFTADKLRESFADGSDVHVTLKRIAGAHLPQFYAPSTTWEMVPKGGKAFRKLAGEIVGAVIGPALVTACLARDKHGIPKSDIKIEWKRAKEITAS